MILKCENCKSHNFQDKTYGYKMRVHNPMRHSGKKSIKGYRCTVCGNEKTSSIPKEK